MEDHVFQNYFKIHIGKGIAVDETRPRRIGWVKTGLNQPKSAMVDQRRSTRLGQLGVVLTGSVRLCPSNNLRSPLNAFLTISFYFYAKNQLFPLINS